EQRRRDEEPVAQLRVLNDRYDHAADWGRHQEHQARREQQVLKERCAPGQAEDQADGKTCRRRQDAGEEQAPEEGFQPTEVLLAGPHAKALTKYRHDTAPRTAAISSFSHFARARPPNHRPAREPASTPRTAAAASGGFT